VPATPFLHYTISHGDCRNCKLVCTGWVLLFSHYLRAQALQVHVTNEATAYSCSRTCRPQWTCSVPQSHPSRFNYGRNIAYFSESRSIRNFKNLSPIAAIWRPSELVTLNTHVPIHVQTSIYRIQAPTPHLYSNKNFKPSCNSFCLLHKVGDNLVTLRKLRYYFKTFVHIVT